MSRKKRNIIVLCIIFAVLLISGGAVAFRLLSDKDDEVIATAENKYNPGYLNNSFYEQHPDITVDGVLDEACWQGKNWFKNTYYSNVNGVFPRVSYTAFPTEYGAYVAAIAEDTNIINNGQRSQNDNTHFSFTLGAYNVGEKFEEDGGLGNQGIVVDMRGEIIGFNTNFVAAVEVEGEINSGQTKQAVMEAFIPWDTLDIDLEKGVPTEVYMMPRYTANLDRGSNLITINPMTPNGNTIIYYCFDENGYTQVDSENAVVGDSVLGNVKDATWDLSQESKGVIRSSPKAEYHNIFFRNMIGSNFIVETTIIPVKGHYGWANAGIIFHTTANPNSTFFTVMMPMDDAILVDSVNGTKNFPNYAIRTLHNRDAWTHKMLNLRETTNSKAQSQQGVKLTVVKYGGEFWYFADGKFLATEEYSFLDTDVLPGLFSINGDAIFKNYSCKEIDDKQLEQYLKKHGLNRVEVKTKGGGEAITSNSTVVNGESYDLTLTAKSGYRLKSLKINGKEKVSDARKKAVDGVYTISNVKSHQSVEAVYEKVKGITFQGKILSGKTAMKGNVLLTGVNNKELRYELTAAEKTGFKVTIPTGKYKAVVTADGCIRAVKTITLNKDVKQDFSLGLSDFAPTITVNGKTVTSNLTPWNFEKEVQKIVTSSQSDGFSGTALYLRQNTETSDFVASVRADYTTKFIEGMEYQPDLMAGFAFHDGTNSGFLWTRDTGMVTTGWRYHWGMRPDAVLMRETGTPRPSIVTIAKLGDKLYLYFDEVFVQEYDWSEIVPTIKADSNMVVGLQATADKQADIQFSNWSLKKGKAAASEYINSHKLQNRILKENPKFAEALIVNGKQVKSVLTFWKLDEVANNVVKGCFGLTGYSPKFYFAEKGTTALLETKIEYTTQFKEGVQYQPDLFAGFSMTDGTNEGWIAVNDTGIVYTGWTFQRGLYSPLLTYPKPQSVKLTLAVKEDVIYVFFDDKLVTRKSMDEIVPGKKDGAELAFSIYAHADKTCDYKFSNLKMTTNVAEVNKYISEHK